MKTIKPKYLINKKIFKNKKEKRKKGNLEWESTFSKLQNKLGAQAGRELFVGRKLFAVKKVKKNIHCFFFSFLFGKQLQTLEFFYYYYFCFKRFLLL
jgi:hypothetical protein